MITNMAECTNSNEPRSLPIRTFVKTTFERMNSLLVDRGTKTTPMLRVDN